MPLIAIVRPPSPSLEAGLRTHIGRASIEFARAQEQHIGYVGELSNAGAEIIMVPEAPKMPDAVFVEDAALVFDSFAVMARSPEISRRMETPPIAGALSKYRYLVQLPEDAFFDGGDVLVIDRKVFIGQSQRTNQAAIDFLKTLLRQYSYEAVAVPVSGCLHLKTAVTYLGGDTVLINPGWVPREMFSAYTQIAVDEPMGANALLIGEQLLMSAMYPVTLHHVQTRGFRPRVVEIGEFHKAEGGLTCLSIVFQAQ